MSYSVERCSKQDMERVLASMIAWKDGMSRDNRNGEEMPEQKSETGAKILFTFIAVPVAIFAHGYTVSTLWSWFIVPLFNVPEIGILQAAAIMMFVNYFVAKPDNDINILSSKLSLTDYITRAMSNVILKPIIALFVGWVLKELIA